MTPRDEHGTQLSPQRAFVVHLGERGDSHRRRFSGRVEHLASGASMHFSSLGGLLDFFASVLDRQSTPAVARDSSKHEGTS